MHVFVGPSDVDAVRRDLDAGLPEQFRGWPVRFGWEGVPTQHHVRVSTLTDWLHHHLGVDPRAGMTPLDWLLLPQQALLEATRGQVHADPNGQLGRVRTLLTWYSPQVHRWLLACQWERIGQEEAFVGRAAQVGDDLGSRLVTARLTRDLVRLAFLLSRQYWPYPKWFGTAFARLPIATELAPPLQRALAAARYPAREAALVEAYGILARAHNATGLTLPAAAVVHTASVRDGVELGILGELEVASPGGPVVLGASKERLLLAVLAVERQRTVSRDRLVSALWEDERLPRSAVTASWWSSRSWSSRSWSSSSGRPRPAAAVRVGSLGLFC